jgi:hypothetical protein
MSSALSSVNPESRQEAKMGVSAALHSSGPQTLTLVTHCHALTLSPPYKIYFSFFPRILASSHQQLYSVNISNPIFPRKYVHLHRRLPQRSPALIQYLHQLAHQCGDIFDGKRCDVPEFAVYNSSISGRILLFKNCFNFGPFDRTPIGGWRC